jgi:hypothetical protein
MPTWVFEKPGAEALQDSLPSKAEELIESLPNPPLKDPKGAGLRQCRFNAKARRSKDAKQLRAIYNPTDSSFTCSLPKLIKRPNHKRK